MKPWLLATLAAGVWINLSEFTRNELLFKRLWLEKYAALGLAFPSAPANNALWGVWGFLFAGSIALMARRLPLGTTLGLAWVQGFLLMWIVIGNLNVLPFGLLPYAVPWSLVEVGVATLLAHRIGGRGGAPVPAIP